jgi:lipopolysaccharide export LptBFGC system permease protein LptF
MKRFFKPALLFLVPVLLLVFGCYKPTDPAFLESTRHTLQYLKANGALSPDEGSWDLYGVKTPATKLIFQFDNDIGGFAAGDIRVSMGDSVLNVDSLVSFGDGVYEVLISGITKTGTATVQFYKNKPR